MNRKKTTDIDLVITWLDSRDPDWISDKKRWQDDTVLSDDAMDARRFDGCPDLLRYWFRLVEKHAPFVRKIFFVTYGHVPEWLDTNNDKIVIVKHSDFIPKEYLPTFNSAAIEVNLFRIKGLSERFIYFNDDVYLCAPVVPEDFFVENKVKYNYSEGLLCFDESLDLVFRSILLNVARIVNKNFDKWDTMKKRPRTFFSFTNGGGTRNSLRYINFNKYLGPVPAHISMPFLKSTFRDVWRAEHLELDNASRLKFRTASTISPYLVEAWQAFSGKTVPYRQGRFGKLFVEDKVTTEMMDSIEKGLYKVICLNGHFDERSVDDLKKAFLKAVPERSSFEK